LRSEHPCVNVTGRRPRRRGLGRWLQKSGDLQEAAKECDAYVAANAGPTVSAAIPRGVCRAALIYEKTGQPAKADATLKAVGDLTFVDC
jgi:hypothetical protein